MRHLLVAFTLATGSAQAIPQNSGGVIEGRVMTSSGQSVVAAQVTLTADVTGNLSTQLTETIARIVESGNRAGVSQASIDNAVANAQRAAGTEPGNQNTVLTDPEGYFRFAGLAPGRYILRATRDGYFGPPSNGGGALSLVSKVITMDAGNPAVTANLLLTQGGVISGRIRDPYGQPATGVMVSAYQLRYNDGRQDLEHSELEGNRRSWRVSLVLVGSRRVLRWHNTSSSEYYPRRSGFVDSNIFPRSSGTRKLNCRRDRAKRRRSGRNRYRSPHGYDPCFQD